MTEVLNYDVALLYNEDPMVSSQYLEKLRKEGWVWCKRCLQPFFRGPHSRRKYCTECKVNQKADNKERIVWNKYDKWCDTL